MARHEASEKQRAKRLKRQRNLLLLPWAILLLPLTLVVLAVMAWQRHARRRARAGGAAAPAPAAAGGRQGVGDAGVSGFEHTGDLAAMIGLSRKAALAEITARNRDVLERLRGGRLGEMVEKASALEPLVAHTWSKAEAIKYPPFHSARMVDRTTALHRLQSEVGFRRARWVIVLNRPRWGGGRRMEGHIAHALAGTGDGGEIVVITTEVAGAMPPGKFPAGMRLASLGGMDIDGRERVLVEFLRSLTPEAVFIVNSRMAWDALPVYGRALAASMRLIGCFFCNDRNAAGHVVGYPVTQFYRHFDLLSAVCTDSAALRADLIDYHQVPPAQQDKLVVLPAPVDGAIPLATAPAKPRRVRQVFWSGRFDAQKRVDIVYAVARAMPEVRFRLWGERVVNRTLVLPPRPANVSLEGMYGTFTDLPLQEADAWLYTAAWDGVPSILLEVAMTGLPIVGTRVGGTGEVLDGSGAVAVDAVEDVDAYVAGLRGVFADPAAARARAADLRARLLRDRTQAAYARALDRALRGTPGGTAAAPGALVDRVGAETSAARRAVRGI